MTKQVDFERYCNSTGIEITNERGIKLVLRDTNEHIRGFIDKIIDCICDGCKYEVRDLETGTAIIY